MKHFFSLLFALLFCYAAKAQTCADFAVHLTATAQVSPAKITLKWKRLSDSNRYEVYKKTKTALTWGAVVAVLPTTDSTFSDTTAIVDSAYEYYVAANHYVSGAYKWTATGYIYAGIKAPAMHSKGGLVLVVDSTYIDSCADGLHKLMKDISGDGWEVIRHNVGRTMTDVAVKALIKNDYNTIANVKAVLLVGHVAVPYSGDMNPDAHTDHKGSWPADVYYADMTGTWTDASVNNVTSPYSWIKNVPGDGKWDQTQIPAFTKLQVSRIDVYDMPAFSSTDIGRMRSYLAKDHIYKMDSLYVRHRAIVSDNFGVFSLGGSGYEAFASTAWRSFPPMLTRDSIAPTSALIQNLDTASFQWAYGCGGGSFTSSGGIGNTADFAASNMNGIFTVLFGSYFGDWNVPNNFLRAPLSCDIPALTSCWAGRPNWYFHHMGLGENIGFSAWWSQNNDGAIYGPSDVGINQWVHVALMGDLTLRNQYIKPATNLIITHTAHNGATLNWTASADASVGGYYVYRATSEFGSYTRVSGMLTSTTFHDTVGADGLKYYMVRPVKLETCPSGGYNNLGIGITDSATVSFNHTAVEDVAVSIDFNLYPNPANDVINVAIDANAAAIATLSVINVKGERFATANKQLQQGQNVFSLQVSDLPAGMYSIQVTTGGITAVKKWIKL